MTTHIEDKPQSGIVRRPYTMEFTYRYGALCGVAFYGGDPKHSLSKPNTAPTCEIYAAVLAERKATP